MTNKPGEMAAEIPEIIKDPTRSNTNYERGRFLGKVMSNIKWPVKIATRLLNWHEMDLFEYIKKSTCTGPISKLHLVLFKFSFYSDSRANGSAFFKKFWSKKCLNWF